MGMANEIELNIKTTNETLKLQIANEKKEISQMITQNIIKVINKISLSNPSFIVDKAIDLINKKVFLKFF